MKKAKGTALKVQDRGHYSDDYAQLGKDEVSFSFSFVAIILFYLKCTLISLCALLPDCAKPIYRYIYMRERFSTTDDVFVLLLD